MNFNQDSFLFKAMVVVGSLLVLRVGWIAVNLFGGYIAIGILAVASITTVALICAPERIAGHLKRVVEAVRGIFR